MRSSQDFSLRYPYVEVEGSNGDPVTSGNWASARYTSSRLSDISNFLFNDIEKDTINEWRDNYDDTEQYPSVLPTKGFYGIVNGATGIGIGAACSCPQFNIREVNEALIKLLYNFEVDFDEIYCVPDFATGAILLNESEVKESLRNGKGAACKLRSVVNYDSSEKCLVVTEIPYGVYTSTICGELDKLMEEEDSGIDRYNDLTKGTPIIKIYLKKTANPDKVIKYLYKNTSLQSHFGINLTLLENGRYPKVFGWREALQAHLDHEIEVYRNGFVFDLKKIKNRLHIIEGLLKAISIIDEVIALIKGAADTANASRGLQQQFGFTETQAKAILDIKLARLAHLEVSKLEKEKSGLEKEKDRIESILQDELLLKKEIENGLREVIKKFGDARRTKILDIAPDEEGEPIEEKGVQINLTNKNNLIVNETSTLYAQRRGGVGTKFKLDSNEFITHTTNCKNTDIILVFTEGGTVYSFSAADLSVGIKTAVEMYISELDSKICAIAALTRDVKPYIVFVTKKGIVKKSSISEYKLKRSRAGVKAIQLDDDDTIVKVLSVDEEQLGIVTSLGNFIIFNSSEVRNTGRVTRGVKGITLSSKDCVTNAHIITPAAKEFVSLTAEGKLKRTSKDEFVSQTRGGKGLKIQKIVEGDMVVDFLPITNEAEVYVIATSSQIKLKTNEISLLSKNTLGTTAIKLKSNDKAISLGL